MVTVDNSAPTRRIAAALARAIVEASGAEVEVASVEPGVYEELLAELGEEARVHLEFELAVGRHLPSPLVVALRFDSLAALFKLDQTDLPDEPQAQLDLLSRVTERGESLALAMGSALSGRGAPVTARFASSSIEHAGESGPAADLGPGDGEAAAEPFAIRLDRPAMDAVEVVALASAALMRALDPAAAIIGQPPLPPAGVEGIPSSFDLGRAPAAAGPGGAAGVDAPGVTAHPYVLGQLEPGTAPSPGARSLEPILDVPLRVRVELGSTEMVVEEVLALGVGTVIELDRVAGDPVDIVVNNRLLARGEVVVVDEYFGVRITEIVRTRTRLAG